MKITAVVACLAGLTETQVQNIVAAVDAARASHEALAKVEPPKKRRGRKLKAKVVKDKVAPKAAKTKPAAAKAAPSKDAFLKG